MSSSCTKNIYQQIFLVGRGKLLIDCAQHFTSIGLPAIILEDSENNLLFSSKQIQQNGLHIEPISTLGNLDSTEKKTLIFSANNIRLFPDDLTQNKNIDIFNYHNALLPYHRGVNAEAWSIFDEDYATGVTWHKVDSNIDKGEIVSQEIIELDDTITSIKLLKQQTQLAFRMFQNILPSILSGTPKLTKQSDIPIRSIHYKCDRPNHGILNIRWPAHKIWAFLRAMDYGKLASLGIPIVQLGNRTLTWQTYSKKPSQETTSVHIKENIWLHGVRECAPLPLSN